ncbi:uncharacterized protein I303_105179 [Kwoniella dejecticola CBS 10117]|uniref:Uncharacterized protein n=1 Tax=Kwoniella dejecticola CBS 10117 TaxID=1296121 RepID=A0A1A6A392_9TREE|nr:uncharacterized protein I303_05374 [Kwoniella dejecticola CBS 10117]OBR84516.1 hypothetical protein I303_05374 [Kwoniella dejecticola CBS 10117]
MRQKDGRGSKGNDTELPECLNWSTIKRYYRERHQTKSSTTVTALPQVHENTVRPIALEQTPWTSSVGRGRSTEIDYRKFRNQKLLSHRNIPYTPHQNSSSRSAGRYTNASTPYAKRDGILLLVPTLELDTGSHPTGAGGEGQSAADGGGSGPLVVLEANPDMSIADNDDAPLPLRGGGLFGWIRDRRASEANKSNLEAGLKGHTAASYSSKQNTKTSQAVITNREGFLAPSTYFGSANTTTTATPLNICPDSKCDGWGKNCSYGNDPTYLHWYSSTYDNAHGHGQGNELSGYSGGDSSGSGGDAGGCTGAGGDSGGYGSSGDSGGGSSCGGGSSSGGGGGGGD